MSGAAALDREKLAKLLGMLGSSHDGEILNAAKQAERLRQAAGLSWPDLISSAPPTAAAPPYDRETEDFRNTDAAVWFCLDHHPSLSDWESSFLWSLVGYRRPLSPRQRAKLDQLVAKARFAHRRRAA